MDKGLVFAIFVWVSFALMFALGESLATNDMTQEAIDRGYMVQCVGKTGWHWECE